MPSRTSTTKLKPGDIVRFKTANAESGWYPWLWTKERGSPTCVRGLNAGDIGVVIGTRFSTSNIEVRSFDGLWRVDGAYNMIKIGEADA